MGPVTSAKPSSTALTHQETCLQTQNGQTDTITAQIYPIVIGAPSFFFQLDERPFWRPFRDAQATNAQPRHPLLQKRSANLHKRSSFPQEFGAGTLFSKMWRPPRLLVQSMPASLAR